MVLVDTHCHVNMMVKSEFDVAMAPHMMNTACKIVDEAAAWGVTHIINVGTSLIESKNCVVLAQQIESMWATIGIHPNDATDSWKHDIAQLANLLKSSSRKKIVAMGECGIDRHYPDYNLQRQVDVFRAQIEL